MPIKCLPDSTVSAIGSLLVLNDSCSLVKELIDNALDAKATSIAVEISTNTLDAIQVRDNGLGIGPDDRQHVCRRNFTSKLESIEELETIGGRYLGFRGQALASVAEVSGEVILTTRIDGEIAATKLTYGRNGELVASGSASHPVGTTIRIHDFLKHVPVRRQTVLKSPTKILSAIKKVLQQYAFARPCVRFSIKVLKGKNEKLNWIYGPKLDATVKDVAVNVGGQALVLECVLEMMDISEGTTDRQAHDPDGLPRAENYSLNALLPKSDADFSKVRHLGQFVSIDGRPLNTVRGFGKDLTKLYKSYIRAFASQNGETPVPPDPFLCLNMKCPPGSYDINVEPAKDDVLFAEPALAFRCIEAIFKRVYGDLPPDREKNNASGSSKMNKPSELDFDLLLAKAPILESPSRPPISDNPGIIATSPINQNLHKISPRIGQRNERLELPTSPGWTEFTEIDADFPENREPLVDSQDTLTASDAEDFEIRKASVTNPWSLAKVNARLSSQSKRSMVNSFENASEDSVGASLLSSPVVGLKKSNVKTDLDAAAMLPSPAKSTSPPFYQNPGPPKRPWRLPRPQNEESIYSTQATGKQNSQEGNIKRSQSSLLDSWIKKSASSSPTLRLREGDSSTSSPGGRFSPPKFSATEKSHPKKYQRYDTYRGLEDPYLETPGRASDDAIRKSHIPAFKTPFNLSTRAAQGLDSIKGFSQTVLTPKSSVSQNQDEISIPSRSIVDLEEIMEFEHRKKAAQQAQRQAKLSRLQQSSLALSNTANEALSDASGLSQPFPQPNRRQTAAQSPHHNRYLAAKSALTRVPTNPSRDHSHTDETKHDQQRHQHPPLPTPSPRHPLRMDSNQNPDTHTKPSTRQLLALEPSRKRPSTLHTLQTTQHVPTPSTAFTSLLALYTAPSTPATKQDAYIANSGTCAPTAEHISSLWGQGDIGASNREIDRWEERLRQLLGPKIGGDGQTSGRADDVGEKEVEEEEGTTPVAHGGGVAVGEFVLLRCLRAFVEALADEGADDDEDGDAGGDAA